MSATPAAPEAGHQRPAPRPGRRAHPLRALAPRSTGLVVPDHRRPRAPAGRADPGRAPARGAGTAGRGVRARPGGPLHPAVPPAVLGRPRGLPARVVHHEVQPQGVRRGGRPPRAGRRAPRRPRLAHPGVAGPAGRAGGVPLRDHRHGGGHPAAGGRGRRRADRPAADAGLARRPGTAAPQGHHPRLRPRDQPRLGDPRRLRGGHRPQRRPGLRRHGGPGVGARRRRGRHHAHQPEHPGTLRGGHRRHRRRRPRGRGAALLRRRQPQRHPRTGPARGHGLRHRPHEPAQDVRHPPRGWGTRGRPGGGLRAAGPLPPRSPTGAGRGRRRRAGRLRVGRRRPGRSAGCTRGTATPWSWPGPWPTSC